jgi:anti-sigma factor ChrR (cupin superfamily)
MSTLPGPNGCGQVEQVCAYALRALPESEAFAIEAHLASCPECAHELASLQPALSSFAAWPRDVLRPPASLQVRLTRRIAAGVGKELPLPAARPWSEPEWEDVAPGISCKLLASDEDKRVVTMLVRLAPGAQYPPHTHAGVEELYLLDGELWIDDRKLYPGDYNRAEPGTRDQRVWSETGCTCVLITSSEDALLR